MPRFFRAVSDDSATISLFTNAKLIKLTHTGALTDYQAMTTIVYENSMLDNFDDIRFVNASGEHIPYWIESQTDGSTADVWFMYDGLDGDTYIWMYYGNELLESISDAENIFNFYDDFPGSSIDTDKWEGDTGSVSVTGGILTISGINESVNTIINFSPDKIMEFRSQIPYSSWTEWGFREPGVAKFVRGYMDGSNNWFTIYNGTGDEISTNWDTSNQWTVKEFRWGSSFTKVQVFEDDVERTNSPYTGSNIPSDDLAVVFYSDNNININVDWIRVREYAETEPTITVGAEQHASTIGSAIL